MSPVRGTLPIIASKEGRTVDGYSIDTEGKPYSTSFLWGGTESMFAELGFHPIDNLGSSKRVTRKVVRGRCCHRCTLSEDTEFPRVRLTTKTAVTIAATVKPTAR